VSVKNRLELRAYIRFQLAQLSQRNGAHEFEQLCFALARLRHVSNVQPATGPVQAGGDQGRDFESYRTYLRSSSISSSAFLSLMSSDMVAGACTMEKRDTAAKVRSDLAVIFGSGVRPDAIIYFCEADVPVARRHQLQEDCLATYGATLSLQDGTAIADQLADPDTFWIAEQYLLVPADMFPSDVGDADYLKRRTRWLDERTQRIEAKLDGLVKDEEAVAAERRWAYIQNHPIRRIAFFFVLKGEVGLEWFRGILNETRLTFAKDGARWSLGTLLEGSGPPNIEKRSEEADRAVSAFWEMYRHAPGYWVRRTDRTPRHFSVVSGFDVTAPWSLVGVPEVTKLADLASLNEIHLSIPPAAYLPGIEDFVIDFIGDTFTFSVALSDHGLSFLHQMAHTFRALGGKAEIGSFGTGFSGVQLLQLFRDQLGPSPKNPRKGIGLLGLSGPEDSGIAFYPTMPPDFTESPEAANYNHTVTLSGVREIDLEDHVKVLEAKIAAQPSDPNPYAELAARYARQGRITDSIRWLEKAIAHATPDATIHGLLGEAFMEIGRDNEAADHFAKAADLDPEIGAAHTGVAACLLRSGDSEKALPHLEAAARLESSEWRNHANLAFALAANERSKEAIASYQRAVDLEPNEVDNLIRLGWVFEIEERYEEALETLQRAVSVKPEDGEARWHTGRMLAKLGRFVEAVESLRTAIAIEETADRLLSLGDAFVQLARWSDAQIAFQRALELGAADLDIQYALAAVMVNQHKLTEAKSVLENLLRKAPAHEPAKKLLADLNQ
jgi:tetratricopeptide (TPR) repeat protein